MSMPCGAVFEGFAHRCQDRAAYRHRRPQATDTFIHGSFSRPTAFVGCGWGFTLAAAPLMRRTGVSLGAALGAIWIGEGLSIGVMEIVMNAIDYRMGGMRTGSVFNLRFWGAVATAIAFLVAWPVNAWLIARKIKQH